MGGYVLTGHVRIFINVVGFKSNTTATKKTFAYQALKFLLFSHTYFNCLVMNNIICGHSESTGKMKELMRRASFQVRAAKLGRLMNLTAQFAYKALWSSI